MAITYAQIGAFVHRVAGAYKVAVNPADLVALTTAIPTGGFVDKQGRLKTPVTHSTFLPPLSVTIEADPTVAVNDIQMR